MKIYQLVYLLPLIMGCLIGCKPRHSSSVPGHDDGSTENIDRAELEDAAKLKAVADPVQEEIDAFSVETRKLFDGRRFDDLEKLAGDLRIRKALFRDGSWKIRQFYTAFEPSDDEPDQAWKAVDHIHQEWIKAKPASITAHVAHANFFANYAWFVRGSGYADTVSERENFSFEKRLESALKVLQASRDFPVKESDVVECRPHHRAWPRLVEKGIRPDP